VETQKGAVEVEIWQDGTVDSLVVQPGTSVPVGTVLAKLSGESPVSPAPPPTPAEGQAPPSLAAVSAVDRTRPGAVTGHEAAYKMSPVARRRAQELGVDVSRLRPSGPEQVISLEDVERAARERRVAPEPADRIEAMRRAIAAAMAKSKREIPHYYLGTSVDVTAAVDWLAQVNASRSIQDRILFAAVLLRGVALALREVPELNGFWLEERLQTSAAVHLGVAVALRGGGLIAPAIRDAHSKGIAEIMAAMSDLVRRARAGSLRSSELSEATITVTNLGEQGCDSVYGVIYPPQVGLVGFGRIGEHPWVVGGNVQARRIVQVTLSADHRASVGHRGAIFLSTLEQLLRQPEKL